MGKKNDSKKNKDTEVTPIHWKQARSQPRVRPQWDPAELANELLDEMEREDRLPPTLRRR